MKFGKIILFSLFVGGGILLWGADFVKAEILFPDGVGGVSEWTGTYDQVNEYPQGGDTGNGYNTVALENKRQSYSLKNTAHTSSVPINSVKVVVYAKGEGVAEYLNAFLRIGAGNYDGSNCTVITTTEYTQCSYTWTQNPSSSQNWAVNDLNSLQAGFQSIANGVWDATEMRVTQLYAQVEYSTEINTAKYHVIQKIAPISPGTVVSDQFNFFIADDLDEVKSAHIEIKGVAIPYSSLYLNVSVDDTAIDPISSPRLKTYTVNATGRIMLFKLVYDTTDYFKTFVSGGGNYSRYLNFKITDPGSSVYVLNAKLIITYSWVKPPVVVGAYRASGTLISSTFDTGSVSGAAYNSILWKSDTAQPAGTKVKFQIAAGSTSNPAPSDFIGGSGCDSSSWWEPTRNEPMEIKCFSQLNNKRYFRYKIMLCSSNDCANPGNSTPQIDDVIINFSP